eukprot:gene4205-5266_t
MPFKKTKLKNINVGSSVPSAPSPTSTFLNSKGLPKEAKDVKLDQIINNANNIKAKTTTSKTLFSKQGQNKKILFTAETVVPQPKELSPFEREFEALKNKDVFSPMGNIPSMKSGGGKEKRDSALIRSEISELQKEFEQSTDSKRKELLKHQIMVLNEELLSPDLGALDQFLDDFNRWLLGRGKQEDHELTPWGRLPLSNVDPSISEYLMGFYTKRQNFLQELMKLKNYAIFNLDLNTAYLYFKYIIRGKLDDPATLNYLTQWDNILKLDEETKTKYGIDDETAAALESYYDRSKVSASAKDPTQVLLTKKTNATPEIDILTNSNEDLQIKKKRFRIMGEIIKRLSKELENLNYRLGIAKNTFSNYTLFREKISKYEEVMKTKQEEVQKKVQDFWELARELYSLGEKEYVDAVIWENNDNNQIKYLELQKGMETFIGGGIYGTKEEADIESYLKDQIEGIDTRMDTEDRRLAFETALENPEANHELKQMAQKFKQEDIDAIKFGDKKPAPSSKEMREIQILTTTNKYIDKKLENLLQEGPLDEDDDDFESKKEQIDKTLGMRNQIEKSIINKKIQQNQLDPSALDALVQRQKEEEVKRKNELDITRKKTKLKENMEELEQYKYKLSQNPQIYGDVMERIKKENSRLEMDLMIEEDTNDLINKKIEKLSSLQQSKPSIDGRPTQFKSELDAGIKVKRKRLPPKVYAGFKSYRDSIRSQFMIINTKIEKLTKSVNDKPQPITLNYNNLKTEISNFNTQFTQIQNTKDLNLKEIDTEMVDLDNNITVYNQKLYKKLFYNTNNGRKLIPGPTPIPILGNLHQLGKQPHQAFFKMTKKFGHFFRVWMGDRYAIVTSDPKLVREIWVQNLDSFNSVPKTPSTTIISNNFRGLVSAEGERWKILRAITGSAFSMLKIKTLATTIIEKQTNQLISQMKEISLSTKKYDPARYNKKFSMNVILNYVFSEEIPWNESVYEGNIHRLTGPIDRLFKEFAIGHLGDYIQFLNKPYYLYKKLQGPPIDVVTGFIREIYEQHLKTIDRENPRDLLDSIIIELNQKEIEPDVAVFVGNNMILAGTDTSSTTITWFMLLMANNPNIQEKVYEEIKQVFKNGGENQTDFITCKDTNKVPYLNATIKEVMRYKPIAPLGLSKVSLEDCNIGEFYLPKGTQVVQNTYALCRSQDFWIEPEAFRPERFLNDNHTDHFLPFSVGPRHCIGLNLAKEEIFSACANIILNFKISRINDQLIDEYENFGTTISPNPFEIILETRQ